MCIYYDNDHEIYVSYYDINLIYTFYKYKFLILEILSRRKTI